MTGNEGDNDGVGTTSFILRGDVRINRRINQSITHRDSSSHQRRINDGLDAQV